ncbi:MAG TPA: hypothetical protein PKM43_23290 [Verrucomicrobiota bacterium]|nr:hypothetical protein [Verrucomicrobiota bacterium]
MMLPLRDGQHLLHFNQVALGKRNGDLFAHQFDVDHGRPVSSFSNRLLGTYLGRDILGLDGSMLELGGTKRTKADNAAGVVGPRCLRVRDQVDRFEVRSAIPPWKAIRLTTDLASSRVLLVKKIPNGLILRIPNVDNAFGDSLSSGRFTRFPGHVTRPRSLSAFRWIRNGTGPWPVIRDACLARSVECIVQGSRDIFRRGLRSGLRRTLLRRSVISPGNLGRLSAFCGASTWRRV